MPISSPLSDDQSTLRSPSLNTILAALGTAAAYCVGTIVGFALTPQTSEISTLWPPNAVVMAALLLTRPRQWVFLLLAVLPAHLAIQLSSGVPTWTTMGWFISNISEALLGAILITRFSKVNQLFSSIRGVTVFLLFGFLIAPLLTSFEDAAVVVLTQRGQAYWDLWTSRLFSNMLSILVVVPPIVTLGKGKLKTLRETRVAHYAETLLLITGVLLVSIAVFGGIYVSRGYAPALVYAPLPFLLWAAVRLGPGGLSGSLLVVAVVSIDAALHGRGPFTSLSLRENVVYLQILLCAIAIPLMCLAAILSERQAIQTKLRTTNRLLVAAQEQERNRIARELHDDVSQRLALLEIRLTQTKEAAEPSTKPKLQHISEQVKELSRVIRELSHGLYPSLLQHLGLVPALKRLTRETCGEMAIQLDLPGDPRPLSAEIALSLFRVAQEALNNIQKHSRAHLVSIELKEEAHRVVLRIADDGVGFDANQSTEGLGLNSMHERMEAIGGTVSITSRHLAGTAIEASAPYPSSLPSQLEKAS
ncbi:MAG TPA: MASE1 domain-containing protein [Terriglobales bacterium]|nr:MASE1 domain-containing protein [Terriglobales bacterium]